MLIFLFKKNKNNTWLIVLGLTLLLRRETSSLPFVFLDRRQSSLCYGFSQCQASDPRSQSNTHNPSPQSATNSYTITNLNNQAIVPSFNASRTTHRATLVVIITAIAICFNDRSSPTDKSFQLLICGQSCKFHATERLARRRGQCLNLGHSRLTSVCRVGITIVTHV